MTKRSVINPKIVVPTLKGNLIPILSATQPQDISPNIIPAMATENIKPNILGETPMDAR